MTGKKGCSGAPKKPNARSKNVPVRLYDKDGDYVESEAERRGWSKSKVIAEIVREHVERITRKKP